MNTNNNSDTLLDSYLSKFYYNRQTYNYSWDEFNLWLKNNSKKNIFDYMIENNFEVPSHSFIFKIIPTLDNKNFNSFTKYIDYLISKNFDIKTVSNDKQGYSNQLNLFEYSVECANSKAALFFYKKNVLPDIEENGFTGITKILEYGLFDVLKIYKSLGFKGFKKDYGYTGFIHYVALSGSVIETLRTDENLERGISRLEILRTKFPDFIPKEISQYDIKILDQGIEYLENMRDDLTTRDKKVAQFLYSYIKDFTNNQYSNKPRFIKYGKNYLKHNDNRANKENITDDFWNSYLYFISNRNMNTYGLIHYFSLSKSKNPFAFLNKLDVPAPSNEVIRKMVSFSIQNPEFLKSFTVYLKKIQNQGIDLKSPLVVDKTSPYSCYNEYSIFDLALSNKEKDLVSALESIGLSSHSANHKNKVKIK